MLTERELNTYKIFESSLPDEFKLLKEINDEKFEAFVKRLQTFVDLWLESTIRLNRFIDLASEATGRPYIIETGSNLDVADALFNMTDEWLKENRRKKWVLQRKK